MFRQPGVILDQRLPITTIKTALITGNFAEASSFCLEVFGRAVTRGIEDTFSLTENKQLLIADRTGDSFAESPVDYSTTEAMIVYCDLRQGLNYAYIKDCFELCFKKLCTYSPLPALP